MSLPIGEIICGDCLDVMRGWDAGSVDCCICDPPYGLSFMGKKWDYDVPGVELWREMWRVLKDGGRLLAFSGARTQHRMVCNIEDAGFTIEDCMMWLYGSGFPKHGSKLKPAYEPICVARKGKVSLLNIDAARIGTEERTYSGSGPHKIKLDNHGHGDTGIGMMDGRGRDMQTTVAGRWPANVCLDEWLEQVLRLRYNIGDGIHEAISAYYQDYDGLQNLRERVSNLPLSAGKEQGPVLQPALLQQSAIPEDAGRGPLSLREEAPSRVACQDEGDQASAWLGEPGQGQSELQGPLVQPGLQDHQPGGIVGGCVGTGAGNDDRPEPGNTGASAGNGDQARQAVAADRIGTSHKRSEGRQSPGESGPDGTGGSCSVTPGDHPRIESIAPGKRTLEVLACDVPPAWLCYFVETGKAVRMGAAAMLDEQSGTLTSGTGAVKRATAAGHQGNALGAESRPAGTAMVEYGDSGGASRYYYCAKVSPSERDGSTHPTMKPLALMQWLVRLATFPGETVLDPFFGSGTTGVACNREGRKWIGIDRDESYCEIARKRTAQKGLDLQTTQ